MFEHRGKDGEIIFWDNVPLGLLHVTDGELKGMYNVHFVFVGLADNRTAIHRFVCPSCLDVMEATDGGSLEKALLCKGCGEVGQYDAFNSYPLEITVPKGVLWVDDGELI